MTNKPISGREAELLRIIREGANERRQLRAEIEQLRDGGGGLCDDCEANMERPMCNDCYQRLGPVIAANSQRDAALDRLARAERQQAAIRTELDRYDQGHASWCDLLDVIRAAMKDRP